MAEEKKTLTERANEAPSSRWISPWGAARVFGAAISRRIGIPVFSRSPEAKAERAFINNAALAPGDLGTNAAHAAEVLKRARAANEPKPTPTANTTRWAPRR